MNEKMFISLARNNIKKNKGVFFPFALSASSMIALYYVISSVSASVVEATGFTVMKRCASCSIWGPGFAAYLQPELFFIRTAFC